MMAATHRTAARAGNADGGFGDTQLGGEYPEVTPQTPADHMPPQRDIPLGDIQTDAQTQMRVAGVEPDVVSGYASDMAAGATFPGVTVFRDADGRYWLADGFHRVAAAREAQLTSIAAIVHDGGRREAMLMACGVNAKHGVRRNQADRRKSIETMLRDPYWVLWSNREIARQCQVDHKTVAKVRDEIANGGEIPSDTPTTAAGGEIPKTPKPKTSEGVLAGIADGLLLEECRRRGWTVEVPV